MKLPSGIEGALRVWCWLRSLMAVQVQGEGITFVLAHQLWPGWYWGSENAWVSHRNSPWEDRAFWPSYAEAYGDDDSLDDDAYYYSPLDEDDDDDF
jgi:hypothetical protein